MVADGDRLAQRAFEHWQRGELREALGEFYKACELGALLQEFFRSHIWVLRARLGDRAEAGRELREYLERQWSGDFRFLAYFNFLLGQIPGGELIEITESYGGADRCWAYFFVAMRSVVDEDRAAALRYLRLCLETEIRDCPEYAVAQAELERLARTGVQRGDALDAPGPLT